MKKNVLFIGFLSPISACSSENSEGTLPELNAYSDDQNYVLERMQWLGFDPSIVSTQELKDGLSVIFGYGGNVLVSVGDDGVLIVDTQFPEVYDAMLREINNLGGSSVDYVINTHFHFDHAEGNRAFGPMGADIIAHENSMEFFQAGADIDMVGIQWPQQPYETLAIPRITYSDVLTLNLNGHSIDVMHFGPAHTTTDSMIYFKESNVIHMGDVANLTGLPYIDSGNGGTVDGMINNVREVLEIINDETIVIPGHGEVSTKADIEVYVRKMEAVRDRIAVMIDEGMSLEEVMEADPASDVFPSSPFDGATGLPASQLFVNRAYDSIHK